MSAIMSMAAATATTGSGPTVFESGCCQNCCQTSDWEPAFVDARPSQMFKLNLIMAEGTGFEPAIPLPVYLFSRQAHSTTLPPLRGAAAALKFSVLVALAATVERRANSWHHQQGTSIFTSTGILSRNFRMSISLILSFTMTLRMSAMLIM